MTEQESAKALWEKEQKAKSTGKLEIVGTVLEHFLMKTGK